MRHLMIDFNTSLIEAGYLGEHNATELVVVKPVDVIGVMYSVAFMTNGEVIHSKFFGADEDICVPLWQQLTQDYELGVQLEAYDEKGDYLGKSAMITLLFGSSAHGTDVIADAENPDVYSEIALNTWFRETLEDNVDTLDKLTTSDEGKLLFDGKLIEGAGSTSGQLDIDVKTDTEDEYVLTLSTPDETITTPNLKGKEGKQGVSGVYVGSGDMPDGYNVQIDPDGEATPMPEGGGLTDEQAADLKANTEARHTHSNKSGLDKLTFSYQTSTPRIDINGHTIAYTGEIPSSLPVDTVKSFLRGESPSYVSSSHLTTEGFKLLVDKLLNEYATKELVESLGSPLKVELVETLPETGEEGTIYLVPSGNAENNVHEEYLFVNGVAELIGSTQIDLTNHYTKEEADEVFAKKSDIPIDESYELIGQTPLTLENGGNIKLVSDGETSYEMKTPTVWNFDDITPTFVNCEMSTDKGYYEFITTGNLTKYHQSYTQFILSGLEVGKSYNLLFDIGDFKDNATDRIWTGNVSVWSGTTTTNSIINGHRLINGKLNFTATDTSILIRYYSAQNIEPYVGWVSRFHKMYLNYADVSEELTEIYSNTGTFTDIATFKAIPNGVTITTDPTASVFRKAPTDKTLTQSDVPADAESTGVAIKKVKSLLPLHGKTIVNFGDSIFGNAQPPVDISTYLAEKTDATVYNCGFGGCRMSQHVSAWDAFSMYRLADSIVSGDFTLQETALENTEVDLPDRFTPNLERLKSIDFSKVDIVTIAYGANDFTSSIDMENEENLYDTTTLAGALRYSIEKFLTAYPNLRIFVLSTTYRFWVDSENEYAFLYDSNTFTNNDGIVIAEYNKKLADVAKEYNIPFIDDYNIGINKFNRYQYFNTTDGAHHKETGRKLIASHLAKELY